MERTYTYDVAMFRRTFEHGFTYRNGFLRNVRRYGRRPALTCPVRGRTWSYEELDREANRLIRALAADGVGKNSVVMYQLFNCPEFAFLYVACQKMGAIGCPVNFRFAAGETAFVLEDARPQVFFFDASLAALVEQALAGHRTQRLVMVGEGKLPVGVTAYDEYVAGFDGDDPGIDPRWHIYDETTRLYTSGTTGRPKGVPVNNVNEVLSAHDVIMHFPLSPLSRTLNMKIWFHRGGLYSGGPNPVFYVGGSVVPMRQFDAATCLDWVEKYGLTFLIGAPVNLKMLHDEQLARPRDLRGLEGIVTMGAPLEREACIRYQEVLTPNIFNGYGSTEAFWNTFLRPFDLPEHAGSAGRACTDDDVAVVRVYGDRLAEPDDLVSRDGREVGEVAVRSPKCAYAYHNRDREAAARFYKGWLYIGDLATWDGGEFVTIVSRKDDMIISGGENIYPVQVEEALNGHPGVRETVVTGVPDEKWGQLVAAYVVRRDPALTAAELDAFCQGHPMLARFKRPRYYRFVENLPFTATGKKMHYKVREDAAADLVRGLLERV
ncbi:MAG: AMP-binding protein [Peptococcaceae bacterium]|nr:AMP-binding protein [Peptococcaceae bacterium]